MPVLFDHHIAGLVQYSYIQSPKHVLTRNPSDLQIIVTSSEWLQYFVFRQNLEAAQKLRINVFFAKGFLLPTLALKFAYAYQADSLAKVL